MAQAQITNSNKILRFLVSGGVNTAATYLLYLALIEYLDYKLSYSISYAFGILLAYILSRFFVFKQKTIAYGNILFPIAYMAQYGISLGVIWIWIGVLQMPTWTGPAAALAVGIPLSYIMMSFIFRHPFA